MKKNISGSNTLYSINDKLNVLRIKLREIWYEDVIGQTIGLNDIWLGFSASQSKLEDLEVVIANWEPIVMHSKLMFGTDYDTAFAKYQAIRDLFMVTSIGAINLEFMIMNSDLTAPEKEYLKLKYFI